jgi:hypothetical protein
LLEGEIYQQLGNRERALGAWVALELENANPTRWAWQHLDPPPTTRIDLGSGFDWGYVDGFYTREGRAEDSGNYRWSSPHARLRFIGAGSGQPQTLRLKVAADHHDPLVEGARLAMRALSTVPGGQPQPRTVMVRPGWQEIEIPLGAAPPGNDIVVELSSTTVVPGPQELADRQQVRQQLRLLGVQVDWAELDS